jgi:hypothetical protein
MESKRTKKTLTPEEIEAKKAKAREYAKAYYQANKERLIEASCRWKAENPEKVKEANQRAMLKWREEKPLEERRKREAKARERYREKHAETLRKSYELFKAAKEIAKEIKVDAIDVINRLKTTL